MRYLSVYSHCTPLLPGHPVDFLGSHLPSQLCYGHSALYILAPDIARDPSYMAESSLPLEVNPSAGSKTLHRRREWIVRSPSGRDDGKDSKRKLAEKGLDDPD